MAATSVSSPMDKREQEKRTRWKAHLRTLAFTGTSFVDDEECYINWICSILAPTEQFDLARALIGVLRSFHLHHAYKSALVRVTS